MASDESGDRSRRLQVILDMLATSGRLSVTGAAADLGVSEATVRRDFSALTEQRLATRTHGGVVATSVSYELPVRYRDAAASDDIDKIATAAAKLIEPGTSIGFNGGTTTTSVARSLAARPEIAESPEHPSVTVVTNALNIAGELVLRPYVRTVLTGGVALPQAYELTGPLAERVLCELWLDTLILGVAGLDVAGGATCRDAAEAGVNSLMVQRSSRVVAVTTSDKLGVRTFAKICDASDIDVLVTDEHASPAAVTSLREAGVEVVVAR